jgi:hypothetical protein
VGLAEDRDGDMATCLLDHTMMGLEDRHLVVCSAHGRTSFDKPCATGAIARCLDAVMTVA